VEAITEWLIAFISSENNTAGLALIAGSAAIEYVFPPFPGDTITLLGAVLITAYGWSFTAVFSAVMLGSVVGSLAAFWFGRKYQRPPGHELDESKAGIIDALVARFRRSGPIFLVVNRFVPGVRALFFVAAGMSGMRTGPVLLYSLVSAALWHLGIIALGSLVGANLEVLEAWMRRYTLVTAGLLTVIVAIVAVRWWRRRSRAD